MVKRSPLIPLTLVLHRHHPPNAKAVFNHPELWSPECLHQRHFYFAAFRQTIEHAIGLRFGRNGDGKTEALELSFAFTGAIRCHEGVCSDATSGMHHLVLLAWFHSWRWLGGVAKTDHDLHVRSD